MSKQTSGPSGVGPRGKPRRVRQYHPTRGRRIGDAVMSIFVRAGLVPSTYLLTTTGRKTGIQSDELIEIVEGLKEGEQIVSGSYRAISKDLGNGAIVTIKNRKN